VLLATPPEQSADALFEQAQAAEETGDIAGAERLYRVLIPTQRRRSISATCFGLMAAGLRRKPTCWTSRGGPTTGRA
jgi:hypothetical protein